MITTRPAPPEISPSPTHSTAEPTRPPWWREIALIGICYGIYSVIRNLVPSAKTGAVQHAWQVLHAERWLRLDTEHGVNRLFAAHDWLGDLGNYYYASLHFIMTIGVLIWLYAFHPARYAFFRWAIFGGTAAALIGFWLYPLAPPRMLPGFVDTALALNSGGLYDSSPIASVTNQYAAMPSLHTGWSLWCAIALIAVARHWWVKALAAAYPVLTVVVILGTGNHYLLDAAGGVAVLAAGFGFAWLMTRAPAWSGHGSAGTVRR